MHGTLFSKIEIQRQLYPSPSQINVLYKKKPQCHYIVLEEADFSDSLPLEALEEEQVQEVAPTAKQQHKMILDIAHTPSKQGIPQQPSMSTTTMHLKRKASKAPLVVSEVRRE
jgi:hypothetical protein